MESALKTDDFILAGDGVCMGPIAVRLARTEAEVIAAQKLRYDIFYREYGAKPVGDMEAKGLDYDRFDEFADHLIVTDQSQNGRIVGTYRILRSESAKRAGQFYSASEYDISKLVATTPNLMEVGRSCVDASHRTRNVLQLLWQGIAEYITHYDIGALFGCASFHGIDIPAHADMLSYLHHFHRAPDEFCPRALENLYTSMDLKPKETLNPKDALLALPPLIKGYLRLGGFVGDGAVIDTQFNTIDVCVIVKTSRVSARYRKHYERKVGSSFETEVDASSEII
ncbi:MAG: GNAT family N-acetyltransferase [Alphaproteobacteria bacterium]|nr:GNAT family N-acetyltransferase [Alphaproteobacteria bacterium]